MVTPLKENNVIFSLIGEGRGGEGRKVLVIYFAYNGSRNTETNPTSLFASEVKMHSAKCIIQLDPVNSKSHGEKKMVRINEGSNERGKNQ